MALPGFGYANWQSVICRHVVSLTEYENMPPWDRRDGPDMDIVVEDESTQLELWLREHSWDHFPALPALATADGTARKLRVEFEVKTTIGACSDRLFMSDNQYQRVCCLFPIDKKPFGEYVC